MAVEFIVKGEKVSRGNTEYRLYPEQLTIKHEMNGRHELPDVSYLVADIVARTNAGIIGQIEPVTIRKGPKDEPILVNGFSRWRAISEINKKKLLPTPIPIRCVYTKLSEAEAFFTNISENRFRNSTTPLDDAHNIVRLREVYMKSEEEIARIYHPGATDENLKTALSWVKKTVKLANITIEMEKAIKSGRVKESAVAAIAKLSEEQQNALASGEGTINAKQAKTEKPKKVQTSDKELLRLVNSVLEDISGVLNDGGTDEFIEVERKLLKALNDYVRK
jgi:ParB-like chromosome segregation protein Spo0J